MNPRYTVRVTKDYLVFCAAHFITYDGDTCERLHGHNYRVACELTARLDDNQYVFDFIALKNHLKAITDSLDHRMLVPGDSRRIRHEIHGEQVTLRFEDRQWSFPREDCVILPVSNTTAELLARYIGEKLLGILRERHGFTPDSISVDVEESFGQAATYWYTPG
jgi:6-pyruvoyltetrahydropterin/6-carboxytetrahydropterin synthase